MNRLLLEAHLPPGWRIMLHDLCHRLGVPVDLWPAELWEFVEVAVIEYARHQNLSLGSACDVLGVSRPQFEQRRRRRRERFRTAVSG